MRFTRQQHVRSAVDFQRIRASGKRSECGFFCLYLLARSAQGAPRRLGVVASRRVGNAVHRNRAKRLLREIFRNNQHLLPAESDLLLIARSSLPGTSYHELERRFRKAVNRLKAPCS